MNISPDGFTVRFKTKPEEFFFAEKSGAKLNTVRILDVPEADQIKRDPPKKIIIQYEQEVFLRTLTHICIAGEALGKVIVIFSWANEKQHYPIPNETEQEPPLWVQAINIGLRLRERLDLCRGEKTYDEVISKLLNDYEHPQHQHNILKNRSSEDSNAVKKTPISIAKTMRCPDCDGDLLKSRAGEFGKCAICQALFYLDPQAEEVSPSHD